MHELHAVSPTHFTLGRRPAGVIAAVLLAILAGLLIGSARQESQSFDESTHLGAGFAYWKHGDFGKNPEHPPFIKMLAAIPLLRMGLKEPPPTHIPFFKGQDSAYGTELVYSGGADGDDVLFRGRAVIVLFSLVLGLLIFLATQEIFGSVAAIFALSLYVFQPLLLGNGNVVTTDIALACVLFASVYAFYRFCNRPSIARFAVCGLAVCLTIVTKHSGVLVLPILVLLAVAGLLIPRADERDTKERHAGRIVSALCALFVLSYFAVWAIYGFRFNQLEITPPLVAYAATLAHPVEKGLILFADQHHLFPEPYLYGWVDILRIPSTRPSFLLGTVYSKPQLFFFPAVFVIKTTLALLVFLLLLPFAKIKGYRREFVFFVLPGAFFFAVSVFSMMNGGARYLIPMYPYCILVAGAAAAAFFQRSKLAAIGVSAVLLFGLASTLHGYPNFLAYSNELFGGPSYTYRVLTDPDADWGQGLKWTGEYMAKHPASDCWFDYFGNPAMDFAHFGVGCKPLLSSFNHLTGTATPVIPTTISGTVLVSSSDIDGPWWGPGDLNPYQIFRDRKPDGMIGDIILVYHGTFDVPLLAAETNADTAVGLLRQGRLPEALGLARTASEQAPKSANVQATFGQILLASGRIPEGRQAMANALNLAQSDHPDYQQYLIEQIQHPPAHP